MGGEEEGVETSGEGGGGTVGRCSMSVLNFFMGRSHVRGSKRVVGTDQAGRQAGEREGRERETFRVRTSAREGKEKKETNRSRNGKKVRRGL